MIKNITACVSCLLCQFNCIVFPSPSSSYSIENEKDIKIFKSDGKEIPYLHLPHENPQVNVIFFHGNAEDIGTIKSFLEPIRNALKASIYAIQYPTYGEYDTKYHWFLSNKIKQDSLKFYDFLTKSQKNVINTQNTIVIGRSIGSGGASYLASRKKISNLVLISPLSKITEVAVDFVGCLGKCVIQHFDNIEEISNYTGNLLVVHGKIDEVINHRHGVLVKETYNKANLSKNKQCTLSSPPNMSHNYFSYEEDILEPIGQFRERMNTK